MRIRLASGIAVAGMWLAGCGAGSEGSPGSAGEPVTDDPPVTAHAAPGRPPRAGLRSILDAPVDVMACTALALGTDGIPLTKIATDAPEPTGGSIRLGTYDLTADVVYTGAGGEEGSVAQSFAQTFRVTSDTLETATLDKGETVHASGWWLASGNALSTMEKCPEEGHLQALGFTASGARLDVYMGGDEVLVFTRRP